MRVLLSQRWGLGRSSYARPGDRFNPADFDVEVIGVDAPAKSFVIAQHYSKSYPAARERVGLYERGELVGVAVFSEPIHRKVLDCFPAGEFRQASLELGRLVLLDRVGYNAETWMLARCMEILAQRGYTGIVAYSDPVPRVAADRSSVFPGHIGTIYQAFNASYLGRASPRTLRLFDDCTVFSARAMQKIRARERGWQHCEAKLVRYGATPRAADENPREWLRRELPCVTRTLRHGGNLKYVWTTRGKLRKHLPASQRYPKIEVIG